MKGDKSRDRAGGKSSDKSTGGGPGRVSDRDGGRNGGSPKPSRSQPAKPSQRDLALDGPLGGSGADAEITRHDIKKDIVRDKEKDAAIDAPAGDSFFDNIGETLGAAAIGFAVGGPVGAAIGAGINVVGEMVFGGGIQESIGAFGGPNAERVAIGLGAIPRFATNPVGTIIDAIGSIAGTFKGAEGVTATSNVFGAAALGAVVAGPIGMVVGGGLRLAAEVFSGSFEE